MSANHGPKDTFIYFPYKLTPMEEAQIFMQFDLNCDFDSQDIINIKKETRHLKKICIYKLIISVPEYLLTRTIFGKEEATYKKKMSSLYWRFFRNKISLEKFGKEVTTLLKSGKVI